MISRLMQNIHLIIIGYTLWQAWGLWQDYDSSENSNKVEIPLIQARVKKLEKERGKVKGYLKDIESAKEKIKLVEKEVLTLQKKLPEKIQDTQNLQLLKDIGNSINIKNIFLAPGSEKNNGFYFAKKYDLTGSGTYLQFLLFFEKLSSTEQLFNVSDIEFKQSKVKRRGRYQLVNAKISIEAYRYNPDNADEIRQVDE